MLVLAEAISDGPAKRVGLDPEGRFETVDCSTRPKLGQLL